MPRKKQTDVSGNGGLKRKRGGGKKKEREFSSDDEFDDFEQENTKKPGKPAAKAGLQPVTVADDVKEKIVRTYNYCFYLLYAYTNALCIYTYRPTLAYDKVQGFSNVVLPRTSKYDNLVMEPLKKAAVYLISMETDFPSIKFSKVNDALLCCHCSQNNALLKYYTKNVYFALL